MKYVFLAASSFLAIIAQMVLGNSFFLFNYLDLSLILISYWAMYRNRVQAMFVGSITGVLMDAVLGWPLGYNGFAKTLAAFLIGQAARRFNVDGLGIRFLLIGAASCVSSLSIFLLSAVLQRSVGSIYPTASLILAFVTACVGVAVLSIVDGHNRAQIGRVS